MFKEVDKNTSFIAMEHEILDFWKDRSIFEKLVEQNKGRERFSFLDGPITANNPMGVHHAWGRTYKDLFQRYNAMMGRDQRYQNGFDCQGLWVEVEVEKELGFKSKRDIEEYGIARFVEKCKQRVEKYSKIQSDQSVRLGYWMDWNNSYYTMSDENNFTIWSFLRKCHDKGWIYKGDDVMPWCRRCGTALSEHEIATEGYRMLKHPSITVRFPVKDRPGESLLVWTTTPWTLTSNVAAAVHPEHTYLKVRQGEEIFYLGKARREMLQGDVEVLEELPGQALVGWRYEGPYDHFEAQHPEAHRVVAWDEVSEEDGTGIVHCAPGCGKEDYLLGKEEGLPSIAPLDETGVYIEGFGWLTGRNVEDVTPDILADLKKRGILYRKTTIEHRYPVCWRCSSELVFRLVDEWFISMDALRHQIMDVARKIRWLPSFGLERELDWLRNMSDWCISKKRYWGLALPIFECACGHFEILGSEDELKERAVEGWEQFEGHSPHRPWIDAVKIACAKCGETVSRIPDVGNPWLDAGIVPYSTMNYRKDREYWEKWFPPEFITECFPGQFRNWFYSMLAMSTVMENREPFKCVLGHALVKDENGEEMHKSSGNAIWFEDAAEKMGVDVMRWIFASHNPFNNLKFGWKTGDETRRKLLTLWNTYAFFVTYAKVDGFDPKSPAPPIAERSDLDRWILARLQSLIAAAHTSLTEYNVAALMRQAERFIDDLSNWYVRRSRRRFWKSESDVDKQGAYATLHEVLVTLCKVMAPVIPFMSEEIYRNLVYGPDRSAPESIHLTAYPQVDAALEDDRLVQEVDAVIHCVAMGRSVRNSTQLKVRQPLSRMIVVPQDEVARSGVEKGTEQIMEELNVKSVELMDDAGDLISNTVKPNFKVLGPKYGPQMKAVAAAVGQLDPAAAVAAVKAGQNLEIEVDGQAVELLPEELEVQSHQTEGFAALEDHGWVVALDTQLTEDLVMEGLARDFIRHIATCRKEADFNVDDRITIYLDLPADGQVVKAISAHEAFIRNENLASAIERDYVDKEYSKEIKLAGERIKISIARND